MAYFFKKNQAVFSLIKLNSAEKLILYHPKWNAKHNFSKKSYFFPWTTSVDICKIEIYKTYIYKEYIRPSANIKIKLPTQLRVCLSHLHKHQFKHSFLKSLNHLYSCGFETKSTLYFFTPLRFTWELKMNSTEQSI